MEFPIKESITFKVISNTIFTVHVVSRNLMCRYGGHARNYLNKRLCNINIPHPQDPAETQITLHGL